ncbi:VOC family protein [Kiritimatiellota bacterium B12222]|nr:VOC family protein [Kiritimatiellota bacterium B12222]
MITSIDHLNIVVRDLDLMCDFFVLLGFVVEDRAGLSGEWISEIVGLKDVDAEYVKLAFPGSGMRLELIRYETPHSDKPVDGGVAHDPGFRHLAFAVTALDDVVARLKKEGVSFLSSVRTYEVTGKRLVYFRGPEGILLELAEYPA